MRLPVVVDLLLDVGEQVGSVLSFVEDDRRPERFKEGAGIFPGGRSDVRWFQGDVPAGSAEEVAQKRGLPGLTRAGEHHGRKFGGGSRQHRLQRTLDVAVFHWPN